MTVRQITIDFETESHNIITDIKHGKGNFTYRVDDESQSGQVISLPEINNSIYLDLYVQYYWTNSSGSNNSGNNNYNTCNLKLNWMPRYSDNKEYINELSPEFNQTNNNIKIQFNNESPISINKNLKISNPESEPGWEGQITFDGSESKRNIEIRFTYEYTNNGVTYYINGLNDTYSLKIFPPSSKYARNVVFNEEGINELVGYFKQYPITKLENGEKYGHIKITKGIDEESEVSPKGLENSTENSLLCSTDFIPSENNNFNLGASNIIYQTFKDHGLADYDNNGNYYYEASFPFETSNEIISSTYTIRITNGNPNNLKTFEQKELPATIENDLVHIVWSSGENEAPSWMDLSCPIDIIIIIKMRQNSSLPDNLYWKNLYLSDTVYASELKGKYTGLPIGIDGDSININDKFRVDNEGNVWMSGNVSLNSQGQIVITVYHKGVGENLDAPNPPANGVDIETLTSEDEWHQTYNVNDRWMAISFNGGESWSPVVLIGAKDGAPGASWTAEEILQTLQSNLNDDIFSFPGTSGETKIGIKATAILAELAKLGRIEMAPGNDYNPKDNTTLQGGYITFKIPTPFTANYVLNNSGWEARLGYLRGNGNGKTCTSGIGLVIQSKATWKDYCGDNPRNQDNSYHSVFSYNINGTQKIADLGPKLHLILSSFMLTQSGVGLLLATNPPDNTGLIWLSQDYMNNQNDPHYLYKSTYAHHTGWQTTNVDTKEPLVAVARLWIHEDNGGLYYSDAYGIKPWQWDDGGVAYYS